MAIHKAVPLSEYIMKIGYGSVQITMILHDFIKQLKVLGASKHTWYQIYISVNFSLSFPTLSECAPCHLDRP